MGNGLKCRGEGSKTFQLDDKSKYIIQQGVYFLNLVSGCSKVPTSSGRFGRVIISQDWETVMDQLFLS